MIIPSKFRDAIQNKMSLSNYAFRVICKRLQDGKK